jgi:hypothetical protein
MPGDTLSGCCSSVSFSHSTFLCIAAKYQNILTIGAKQGLSYKIDLKM